MTPYPDDGKDYLYQSLIIVTEKEGSLAKTIPVSTEGMSEGHKTAFTGLWVGSAVINQVSRHQQGSDLEDTGRDFQFRLIVHVDKDGNAHLLPSVLNGIKKENSDNPGERVFLTEQEDTPDDIHITKRISSAAFGNFIYKKFSETDTPFGAGTHQIQGITSGYDDPDNPYKHKYHPDHDNLNERFEPITDKEKAEAFEIKRNITMKFQTEINDEQTYRPGLGDSLLIGDYEEIIKGLNQSDNNIKIGGFFELHRISKNGELIIQ